MENNTQSKKYKIIFIKDKFPVLNEIIKKYGLDGLDEKSLSVLDDTDEEKRTASPSVLILNIVNDVIDDIIQTKDVPGLLKLSLNLSDKSATLMSKDIETKLVSICKKISVEDLLKNDDINRSQTNNIIKEVIPNKKNTNNDASENLVIEGIERSQKKESDKYRESIE